MLKCLIQLYLLVMSAIVQTTEWPRRQRQIDNLMVFWVTASLFDQSVDCLLKQTHHMCALVLTALTV